jgi:predicted lipid-binding transport protein (Tim44 family)
VLTTRFNVKFACDVAKTPQQERKTMRNIMIMLGLAVSACIAFSGPAEAKRFLSSGSSSKPAASAPKPGAQPAANAQTPAAQPAAARGGSTLIILPGIGAAHAATPPDDAERRKQRDAAQQQEAEIAKIEATKKADEAARASLSPAYEIPRLGAIAASEGRPKLPGFSTLN